MEITAETATKLGLTTEEFEKIKELMGRTPNYTELSLYSVMWSEHCSYKNSIALIKTLPNEGSRILVKAGEENAGLVDVGDGLACVFKIESHNHPSAVQPFNGAATGVGGVLRDIFTMGAQPIAALNSLRFGSPEKKETAELVKGVVDGIGSYGKGYGIPTIGGEVYFDKCYDTNPLVNAMAAGIVEVGKTVSATSHGVGNPVFIVGAETGMEGIGGAAFASADLDEESKADLPESVVGDPILEKRLTAACLEVIPTGTLIGMQDMGAAGIICSSAEMSEKGGCGMRIDLEKVPIKVEGMKARDMLLSESQERMLLVVRKGSEEQVKAIFKKWDINCDQIGEVTEGPDLDFYFNGNLEARVPAASLVLGGGAPVYHRETAVPEYFRKIRGYNGAKLEIPTDLKGIARKLSGELDIASKKWITDQYDTEEMPVNHLTAAAVVGYGDKNKALAFSTDCNSHYVFSDPYKGGMIAVAEAARNIVCTGGEPVAITNCLNFGNPYNKEVYYQFSEAVKGIAEACKRFDTPVTGGNVSFYNQSPEGPIQPTPVIGMLGLLEDVNNPTTIDFKEEGDCIYLIGQSRDDVAGSVYLRSIHQVKYSPAPYFNLEEEAELQDTVSKLIRSGVVKSAHDVSEGGLFITLLESALAGNTGFAIKTNSETRKDAFLFGESQSRVVLSVSKENCQSFEEQLQGTVYEKLGSVTSSVIQIDDEEWGNQEDWKEPYHTALKKAMEG